MHVLLSSLLLMISLSPSIAQPSADSIQPSEEYTRIIVLRHAPKAKPLETEKESNNRKDPPLNTLGLTKAEAYADFADLYSISAIYSTNLRRTKDTVRPLSEKTGVKIDTSIKPFDYQAQIQSILTNHKNKTVVIVGHSNTVPGFINHLLPNENMPDLAHDAYDDIFILKHYSSDRIELLKLRHAIKTTHQLLIKD